MARLDSRNLFQFASRKLKSRPENPHAGCEKETAFALDCGLLNDVGHPVAIIGLDSSVMYVNAAMSKTTGFSDSELLAARYPHPWCVEESETCDWRIDATVDPGVMRLEKQVKRKDGQRIWIAATSAPIIREGTVRYFLESWLDITELKRVEEALREDEKRYRLLATHVTDVIWVTDMNLNYTYISPSVERLRGYTAEETMKQRVHEILSPDSLAVAKRAFLEDLDREKKGQHDPHQVRTLDLELKCKDGSTVWTEFKATFLRDADGTPVANIGVTREIKERKRAEAELLRRNRELAALHRLLVSITRTLRLDEVLEQIVVQIGDLLDSQYTRFVIVNQDGTLGTCSEHRLGEMHPSVSSQPHAVTRTIVETGRPVILDDAGAIQEVAPALAAVGVRSYAGMPVKNGDTTIGVLSLHSTCPNAFASSMDLLTAFASQASAAVQNARLYEAVSTERARIERLIGQLLSAEEKERRRLSLDLHDTVIQSMYGLMAHIGVADELLSRSLYGASQTELHSAKDALEQTLADLRRVISGLHPPALDRLGLNEALRHHINERRIEDGSLRYSFHVEGVPCRFPPNVEIAAYRITQEALNNTRRHAAATNVTVRLQFSTDGAVIEIVDDGKGFDFRPDSVDEFQGKLGLTGMKERAEMVGAGLDIYTRPGAGATVRLTIPAPRGG